MQLIKARQRALRFAWYAIIFGSLFPGLIIATYLAHGMWIWQLSESSTPSSRLHSLAICVNALAWGVCPVMGLLLVGTGGFFLYYSRLERRDQLLREVR